MREANPSSRSRRRWRRSLERVAELFGARPRSQGPSGARQVLLQQQLEALLRPLAGHGDLGLAILEGALALVMADGQFHDDEWQLFQRGMALLALSEPQRRGLSLHGEVDLEPVCTAFAALSDPAQCQAIADFYRLLCDADGDTGAAERGTLATLLQALGGDPPAAAGRIYGI